MHRSQQRKCRQNNYSRDNSYERYPVTRITGTLILFLTQAAVKPLFSRRALSSRCKRSNGMNTGISTWPQHSPGKEEHIQLRAYNYQRYRHSYKDE
jgi:hypothetical protein